MSPRVLVTDGERRQTIVAVRNLGRHGVDVTVGATSRLSPAGFSKYASRRFRYPDPATDEAGFIDALEAELRRRPHDAVIPITSPTVWHVVRNRALVERYAPVAYPPQETLLDGLDKWRTHAVARAAGVPTPRTLAPDALDPAAVASELGFPVVVKPRRASGREGLAVCETAAELVEAYDAAREEYGETIVQEFVPNGGEVGVYTIYGPSSQLLGVTVQRRLRTNPPEGGPSTLRETIEAPALVGLADDLLSEMGWCGVAMAEFRFDARSGEPMLLEVNPRFWGSLALSIRAGVDFPVMLFDLATSGDCEPALDYRVGVQARQLLGDLGHLLRRDDRRAALREFLAPAPVPRGFDVCSRDDPVPALGFGLRAVSDSLDRALRARARGSGRQ